jgi:surface antigen
MFESSDDVLQKLCTAVIGTLLVIIVLIIGIRLITNVSNSPSSSFVSGNPNIIAGSINTVSSNLKHGINSTGRTLEHAGRSTGHVLALIPRPFIAGTVWTAHTIGFISEDSIDFIGSSLEESALFFGHSIFDGIVIITDTTSRSVSLVSDVATMNSLTKPSENVAVPVIQPKRAIAAVQDSIITKLIASPASATTATTAAAAAAPPAATATITSAPSTQASTYDAYAWGNCTWWVSIKRSEINDSIPNNWGNAADWADSAMADGYLVDHHPTPGSIMQISDVDHGLGHVAIVESVDSDGTWHISEMNVLGLDIVDDKAEPASAAADFSFIHDKE